ncbi:MAG: Ca2+-dependent phosphoinositide-specific phospholipase C [Planctomycetota bacterium]|nr:Ca2+-dependent phosphoinositide-specific phospholipase C [Planctomycetota bacterium]
MTRLFLAVSFLMVCLMPASCARAVRQKPVADGAISPRLHQMQVIGSHNSYKLAPQPELRELLRPFYKSVDEFNYGHLSLTDQLNLGLRNLEIDVHHDPKGGLYADPMRARMLTAAGIAPWPRPDADALKRPGFKVLHDADFDFRSWNVDFETCLAELRAWSAAHPEHTTIFITMNTKQSSSGVPGSVKPAAFDGPALHALDQTIRNSLGASRLLTPDDIRRGQSTLREGLRTHGWPTINEGRGRFLFVLDEEGAIRDRYLAQFPGLRGCVFFTTADPAADHAAIFIINDPIKDEPTIRDLVHQGFIVRTRADADTREARRNDRSRFEAAMRSGAQIITTDYYIPDRSADDRYMVRFDGGDFIRANPVTGISEHEHPHPADAPQESTSR